MVTPPRIEAVVTRSDVSSTANPSSPNIEATNAARTGFTQKVTSLANVSEVTKRSTASEPPVNVYVQRP